MPTSVDFFSLLTLSLVSWANRVQHVFLFFFLIMLSEVCSLLLLSLLVL